MADHEAATPIAGAALAEPWVIPAEHAADFRSCMRIAVENAAERLSHLTILDPLRSLEAADDLGDLIKAGHLLDQVGWADPTEAETLIEVLTSKEVFAWACRKAHGYFTPAEAPEALQFIGWLEALPFGIDSEEAAG